jgi:hypothetical protein
MQKILRKNDEVKCLSVLVSPLGTEGAAVGNLRITSPTLERATRLRMYKYGHAPDFFTFEPINKTHIHATQKICLSLSRFFRILEGRRW